MDIGELVIKVQQILVLRTVTHNGRGEFIAAVDRIVQGKGQTALTNILLDIVDIIHFKQAGQIVPKSCQQRDIPISVQTGLSAALIAAALGLSRQPLYLVALALVILCKLLNVFLYVAAVLIGSVADLGVFRQLVRGDLTTFDQFLQIIIIRNIIQVAIALPLLHHIYLLTIALLLVINRIAGKHRLLVQEAINHNHNNGYDDQYGDDGTQNSFQQIFCHIVSSHFFVKIRKPFCFHGQ